MGSIRSISKFHKYLAYALIFLNGYKFILPIDISDDATDISISLPMWGTNFDVIHGINIVDFLFISYFFFFGFRFYKRILTGKLAMVAFYLITSLALVGILSTIVNFEIFTDYFEAIRLLMCAIFFMCVIWWTDLFGEVNILRVFIIGLLASASVNLFFTFSFSLRILGGLPQLLGQNGPGGSAGFLFFIVSWFFIISRKKIDRILVFLFIGVFTFTLIISYSKLGMLMGFCGLIAFFAAVFAVKNPRVLRKRVGYLIIAILSFVTWLTQSDNGKVLIEGASMFYYYKIGAAVSLIDKEGGDEEREYYYLAVGEVFLHNPILGVGYNGFGPGIANTKVHNSGKMAEEESFVNANPHNAFLYYISANGILGWVMVALIYLMFLYVFLKIFIPLGLSGIVIFFCIMIASLIHTNTLIGFFNTTVMYLPTAIAVSVLQRRINSAQIKLKTTP